MKLLSKIKTTYKQSSVLKKVIRIAVIAVVSYGLFSYVLIPLRLKTDTMAPAFNRNGIHIINALAYYFQTPQIGDPVAIKLAGSSVIYVSRIIGVPNDTIKIEKGMIFRNGQVLEQKIDVKFMYSETKLSNDQYFVLCDNPAGDVHFQNRKNFGMIVFSQLAGKLLL